MIVFSEYRATQRYLQERLAARGITGDAGRAARRHDRPSRSASGSRANGKRRRPSFRCGCCSRPTPPRRGSRFSATATCSSHAEIPWNPNRLEQRNGRVDRHGQPAPEVVVHHLVSKGWDTEGRGSLEGDLDFLARVVQKVEQIRLDLGSAGPVIARQIEEAMLGRRTAIDDRQISRAKSPGSALLAQERRMRERLADLRDELSSSRETLQLMPDRVERVVQTALDLARQPALTPGSEDGTWIVPALTASWKRATIGLEHPARPDERRPVTFDHDVARNRTDVVLAHLGHPLVRLSLALLRAEVWGTGSHLHRVTLRYAQSGLGGLTAIAHGRLVVTGQSGHRLHEQVISAGVRLTGDRVERLNVEQTDAALATQHDVPVPTRLRERLVPALSDAAEPLRGALQARAGDRARQLRSTLERRARDEAQHVAATLEELAQTIRREALGDAGPQLTLLTGIELDGGDQRQIARDVEALTARLDRIPDEIIAEQAAIRRRYTEPTHRLFPAAVTLLVPEGMRL